MGWWIGPDPWPHQLAAFQACIELLRKGKGRGLVVMPTGTGKTRVMRALLYFIVGELRRRGCTAVPTEEILQQLCGDLRRETRTPFYIDKAIKQAPRYSQITVASHQTIWRRLDKYARNVPLLFDECHHSNDLALCNLDTIDSFDLVLGFTASPWSPECEAIYHDQVLYQYGLQQAIRDGYLCPYQVRPLPEVIPPPQKYELYYCHSNDEARTRARSCAGSSYLGHDTPAEERARLVRAFRAGQLRRFYLNRMLTEGFDCKDVSTIFIDKDTESDLHRYQIVGRGLRRKPDGRGLVVFARDPGAVLAALARAG